MRGPLRVATRGSELARLQAELVMARLQEPAELVVISTRGDRQPDVPIHAIGGTGAFVKEVQEAVRRGDADLAVHSAKDLPAETPEGLVLAAVPERRDPRDALVGSTLENLPTGGFVATGSVRRRAQLAARRPDLAFAELRGNLGTRLEKAAQFDAIVVAAAALDRLGLAARAAELLEPTVMLPQVGQGALAVECRDDDAAVIAALVALDDARAHAEVTAERAFLLRLGGGCTQPCAALARVVNPGNGELRLDALIAAGDGTIVLRACAQGLDPIALGTAVADDLIDHQGGRLLVGDAV